MEKEKYDYSSMYYPYMPYDYKKGMYYNYSDIPIQMPIEDQDGNEEIDCEYMKKMYPKVAKMMQYYIEEECDRMEYDGSYMYDEYPDKEAVLMIIEKLYEKISKDPIVVETEEIDKEDIEYQQRGYCCEPNSLKDLIRVLFLNEMFRRRRRYNRRRRPRVNYRRYPYGSGYDYNRYY